MKRYCELTDAEKEAMIDGMDGTFDDPDFEGKFDKHREDDAAKKEKSPN